MSQDGRTGVVRHSVSAVENVSLQVVRVIVGNKLVGVSEVTVRAWTLWVSLCTLTACVRHLCLCYVCLFNCTHVKCLLWEN